MRQRQAPASTSVLRGGTWPGVQKPVRSGLRVRFSQALDIAPGSHLDRASLSGAGIAEGRRQAAGADRHRLHAVLLAHNLQRSCVSSCQAGAEALQQGLQARVQLAPGERGLGGGRHSAVGLLAEALGLVVCGRRPWTARVSGFGLPPLPPPPAWAAVSACVAAWSYRQAHSYSLAEMKGLQNRRGNGFGFVHSGAGKRMHTSTQALELSCMRRLTTARGRAPAAPVPGSAAPRSCRRRRRCRRPPPPPPPRAGAAAPPPPPRSAAAASPAARTRRSVGGSRGRHAGGVKDRAGILESSAPPVRRRARTSQAAHGRPFSTAHPPTCEKPSGQVSCTA